MSLPPTTHIHSRDAESTIPNSWSIDAYRYKPQNPALGPYWNAFYENPYPSTQESLDTVQRWFEDARRLTHASERGPSCGTDAEETQGHNKVEKVRIHGPLDSHFDKKGHDPSKRDRSGQDDISHTENLESKKAKTRGPRGTYTKQSRTTLWRNKVRAQKHASNIQQFLKSPTKSAECIVVRDEPDLEVIASESDDRVGSSKSSGRKKV
ncbi:unnamed protein product [Rhizoctonia solani]|uniref:Uncharacterized protein n=1 Tax=Rhizoctonia solani TaxID=456999 RepID=A0A8H3CJ11_9AGAM|nr:unnamed protein product [Rhizoctonia solani]